MTKLEQIAKLIQELGYRAQVDDDVIRTSMSGWSLLLFPYPDDSIQLYFGVSVDAKDSFGLDQVNDFNKNFRFIKCYLGDDSVGFEQDFYFDVSKPTAKDDLERIFVSWEAALGLARETLDEAQRKHRERASPPAEAN